MKETLIPKQSKICIYDSTSWNNFLKSRNSKSVEGLFLPRTLTAHLKEETPYLEINKFHEYFGHGSFCEYSKIGKRITKYEQELANIEKKILGVDELPAELHFKLTQNNPYFEQYLILRREFDEFFRKNHAVYEGFAYWLEKQLAYEKGLEKLCRQREQFIQPLYLEIVCAFEQFVKKKSVEALLEKISFE